MNCTNKSSLLSIVVLWVMLLQVTLPVKVAYSEDRSRKEFWLNKYGEVAKDRYAERAREVFNRVLAASDRRAGIVPSFHVINHSGLPWAQSLPDGSILLTNKAIDFCYQGHSAEEGDARVAFVIGHELSHQFNGDFWHYRFIQSAKGQKGASAAFQNVSEIAKDPDLLLAKEIQADQYGVIYAVLAGYDSDNVVRGGKFFLGWEQKERSAYSKEYQTILARKRELAVSLRMKEVSDRIDLFELGAISYRIGNMDDSLLLFKRFASYFPSREVYANIGSVYLRQAYEQFLLSQTDEAFPFALSFGIDAQTRAGTIDAARGFTEDRYRNYQQQLGSALENLKKAVEYDPLYNGAKNSLGCAYIIAKRYYDAVSVLEEAWKQEPNEPNILNNLAVAYIMLGHELGSETLLAKGRDILSGQKAKSRIASQNLITLLSSGKKAPAGREGESFATEPTRDIMIPNPPDCRFKPGMAAPSGGDWRVIEEITPTKGPSIKVLSSQKERIILFARNDKISIILMKSQAQMKTNKGSDAGIFISNRGRNGLYISKDRAPDYFAF